MRILPITRTECWHSILYMYTKNAVLCTKTQRDRYQNLPSSVTRFPLCLEVNIAFILCNNKKKQQFSRSWHNARQVSTASSTRSQATLGSCGACQGRRVAVTGKGGCHSHFLFLHSSFEDTLRMAMSAIVLAKSTAALLKTPPASNIIAELAIGQSSGSMEAVQPMVKRKIWFDSKQGPAQGHRGIETSYSSSSRRPPFQTSQTVCLIISSQYKTKSASPQCTASSHPTRWPQGLLHHHWFKSAKLRHKKGWLGHFEPIITKNDIFRQSN